MWTDWLADKAVLFVARLRAQPPQNSVPARAGGDMPLQYREWEPLVTRFAHEGGIDYATFVRVRRIFEAHLDRLSDARPAEWDDRDAQLAFYINAYNAIVIHQVLLQYPIGSIRDIGTAFARPYAVGPEDLTLHQLFHGKIRAFGDPRIHAAVVPATRGGPSLRAYTTPGLQQELDEQLRTYLRRTTTANVQGQTVYLTLPSVVRWYAQDFTPSGHTSKVRRFLRAQVDPASVLPYITPYLPADIRASLQGRKPRLTFRTYDWSLNDG